MVSRLLLGCGTVGRAVAEQLQAREGDLTVFVADDSRAETLREEGLPAEACEFPDPAGLADVDPDSVFVAVDDRETALATARHVRARHPDAHLVVYGRAADLSDVADEVVDPGRLLGDRVLDLTGGGVHQGSAGSDARRFRTTLRSLSGPLAVVTHDNPDPDAIGSGVALAALARRTGLSATVCYFGEINHQENRALVNLLDLELRELESPDELDEFGSLALVDHSRPGVNDQLDPDRPVDVVIDHHPPRGPVEGGFVDLRQDVGATSTILADYHRKLGARLDPDVATALLYGIRVDTDDFVREVSPRDFQAGATLLPAADLDVLTKVENPSVSPDTFETIAAAVRNRRVEGSVLVTYVGDIRDRDALAQAAELLLGMNGVDTTLVFGVVDETVYVSARARGARLDLGETLRSAFDPIGSAGGHADMAGAQIPLGTLAALPAGEDRSRDDVVESVIAERFLETLDVRPGPMPGVPTATRVPFGDDSHRDATE